MDGVKPSWRDRLRAAPLWVLFVYYAVAFGALGLILPGGTADSVGGAVVGGLGFGAAMTAVTAVWRRRDTAAAGRRGGSERVLMERALRTGELPADPSLDPALMALITRRRSQLNWGRKAGPWVFGTLAVMSVLIALVHWPYVFYAVVFIGFLVWGCRSSARSEQRLNSLEQALRARVAGAR
jgi:hypothetical protein